MNFKTTLLTASSVVAVMHCSTSIAELMPEVCFESGMDYSIYVHFGLLDPPRSLGGSFIDEVLAKYGEAVVKKRLAEGPGPARRKSIIINLQEENNSSYGKLFLDASASITPSGKIEFVWISDDKWIGDSAKQDVDLGSTASVRLGVFDPICRIHESKTVKVSKR